MQEYLDQPSRNAIAALPNILIAILVIVVSLHLA